MLLLRCMRTPVRSGVTGGVINVISVAVGNVSGEGPHKPNSAPP
jgi:hypothetical protein